MRIVFLCTGNSARSQMAEGLARALAKELGLDLEVYSAGSRPAGFVHPLAVEVMKEIGIDIFHHSSKPLEAIPYWEVDLIITLCDSAKDECPYVPSVKSLHWSLPDPAAENSPEAFRRVRDEIRRKLVELLRELGEG